MGALTELVRGVLEVLRLPKPLRWSRVLVVRRVGSVLVLGQNVHEPLNGGARLSRVEQLATVVVKGVDFLPLVRLG